MLILMSAGQAGQVAWIEARGNGLDSWARVDRIHRYTSIVDTRYRNREFAGGGCFEKGGMHGSIIF